MELNNDIETTEVNNLTMFERLKYFFTNPNKLFESYDVKATWLVKVIIILALTVITTIVSKELIAGPQMDLLMQQSPDMTKEQAEMTMALINSPGMIAFMVAIAVGATLGTVFLVPLMYWGLISLFGGKTKYMKIVAVYSLAYIPVSIGGLISLAFAYYTNNYGSILQPQMMDVLFNRLGIFVIWQVLLLVFGFAKISGLKLQKSAMAVAIMWILTTAIQIVPVLLKKGI